MDFLFPRFEQCLGGLDLTVGGKLGSEKIEIELQRREQSEAVLRNPVQLRQRILLLRIGTSRPLVVRFD